MCKSALVEAQNYIHKVDQMQGKRKRSEEDTEEYEQGPVILDIPAPDSPVGWLQEAIASEGQAPRAVTMQLYEKSIDSLPDDPDSLWKAIALLRFGAFLPLASMIQDAIGLLETLTSKNNHPESWFALAKAYLESAQLDLQGDDSDSDCDASAGPSTEQPNELDKLINALEKVSCLTNILKHPGHHIIKGRQISPVSENCHG